MKRILSLFFALIVSALCFLPTTVNAEEKNSLNGEAKSVILMEAQSGKVLYEHQADMRLPPASVTKIMTLLLVMEEIDKGTLKLTDTVQVSERASKMGGSQVYLKAGEIISVEDLLKSVVVSSANDASTALAETVSGSVEAFVKKMNDRARELGMKSTTFENPTGLDDTVKEHLTSARDIAIMSRELLRHSLILNYTTIWTDTIRNGAFGLSNTNRLIRFYNGANGLKTGSTAKAGFCISATALRDGMQLIAVVMGSPTRDSRNETAKALLDYGFASYRLYSSPKRVVGSIRVRGGVERDCQIVCEDISLILDKDTYASGIDVSYSMPEHLDAPVKAGDTVGEAIYTVDGVEVGRTDIRCAESVGRISFINILKRLILSAFFK